MQRRSFLGSLALVPLAAIPFTKVPKLTEVPQSSEGFIERAKYLDYTEADFFRCQLIIITDKMRRIWAPPIDKVILEKEPFKVRMSATYKSIPRSLIMAYIRFVDKDRRMLFQAQSSPANLQQGDILTLNYTIRMD